jgi:hypothetical protein
MELLQGEHLHEKRIFARLVVDARRRCAGDTSVEIDSPRG